MTVPIPILLACFGLLVLFVTALAQMLAEASTALSALRNLGKVLRDPAGSNGGRRRFGLRLDQLEAMRSRNVRLAEPAKTWWFHIEESLESYVTKEGREGWFWGIPPREILREEIVSRFYHSAFYQAVPGILTGLGLLATFIAILLALTGLKVIPAANNTEIVTGIKALIDGLAGKFVSSIVGLILSIAFVLIERRWCERRISNSYEDLLEKMSAIVPTITATRIYLDMHALTARQVQLLEGINAEITNLGSMVSVANSAVPDMAGSLAAEVEQFSGKVGELSNLLQRGIRQIR